MSALPNALIKQGAAGRHQGGRYSKKFTDLSTILLQKKVCPKGNLYNYKLDFLQKHLYNLLKQGDMSMEDIANGTDATQSEINTALTMMELHGLIKRLPGAKYGL